MAQAAGEQEDAQAVEDQAAVQRYMERYLAQAGESDPGEGTAIDRDPEAER